MKVGAIAAFAVALLGLLPSSATAQSYPSRTVSVVVPFPAGGSVDGVARILVQKLNETVGQHFVVENRAGGASGTVGANAVAKAAPDGYTLLLSASVHVINPFLYKSVPYDVVNDFTPVTLLADGPLLVSTTPSVPVSNLKDLFALVRKDPQKYTFGTTSIGSASHLAIELLKRDAGLDTLVVPYKGTAPALTDLMSGQIHLLADPMLSSLPLAQGGKIKALGLTSRKRAVAAPDIPTVEESGGMKGFEFVSWYGLWATQKPAGQRLQQVAGGRGQGPGAAGSQAALEHDRVRRHRHRRRSVRNVYSRRDGEIREDHQGRQDQGRVKAPASRHAGAGARRGRDRYELRLLPRQGRPRGHRGRPPAGAGIGDELRQCRRHLSRLCGPLGGARDTAQGRALAVHAACAARFAADARSRSMALARAFRAQLQPRALCAQQGAHAAHRPLQQGMPAATARGDRHRLRSRLRGRAASFPQQ